MLNKEREILEVHEFLIKKGMDISILELSKKDYEAIANSSNKTSKFVNDVLVLQKEERLNGYTSPVIMLVKMGV